VAVDGDGKVAMGHAACRHGDKRSAAGRTVGEDVDAAGPGIDGVFDQFLDYARGTFDHFAGGDAVDDLFGELGGRAWKG